MTKSKAATRARSARHTVGRRAGRPDAAPQDRNPKFEAIALTVDPGPRESPARVAARAARAARLVEWHVDPVSAERGQFELVPPHRRRRPTPGAAWDAVYRLRAQPQVVHAEPLFKYNVADAPARRAVRAGVGGRDHPGTAGNFEWSLRSANVIHAWTLFGTRKPGAGVVVGHPDTGFTPHPDLADPARLLIGQGFDFDDDDPNPVDDLDDGFLDNPGHGTGTGSVIVSSRGAASGLPPGEFVSGVAPFASLIPIRTTESVVLFSMRGLRRAIDHAVAKGAHVISISLGGPLPSPALKDAVRRATDAGTIVLAAAGNQVRVVVFPAAFEEAIAVAASTFTDGEWSGSSRGDAVDITAPGASVWRARVERGSGAPFRFSVNRGSGTSFAVATTAGVAALWVSFHGFDNLVNRYGARQISRVFKSLLQSTCRTPAGWDTDNFGPGIVDARALLAEPLPDAAPARKLRDPRRAAVAMDTTGVEAFVHLMPGIPRARIERGLAAMLGVSDRELPHALQDVGDELAFQLVMHPHLQDGLTQPRRPTARWATGAPRHRVGAVAPSESSRRLRAWLNPSRRTSSASRRSSRTRRAPKR
ncbi:MAG: S8 family peptidase [Vicinamibacterales bacterium]